MIGDTILLGILGMAGVFLGLSMLFLGLLGLHRVLGWLGIEDAGPLLRPPKKTPSRETAPPPAAAPDTPPTSASSAPVLQPSLSAWRLAGDVLAAPGATDWVRPAFRAAFQKQRAASGRPTEVVVNGKRFQVAFDSLEGSRVRLRVNGREMSMDLGDAPDAPAPPLPPASAPPGAAPAQPVATKKPAPPPAAAAPSAPGSTVSVTAPIPGTVTRVIAGEGDEVDRGSLLLVLEAMKMDNEIRSPEKGRVREIRVQERDAVRQGDLLVVVEPMEG